MRRPDELVPPGSKGLPCPLDHALARRRGKIRGHLCKKGPSWIGSWAESERLSDGRVGWRKRTRKICPLIDNEGRAITKRMAQRFFDEQHLDDLNRFALCPRAFGTLQDFWEQKFEPMLGIRKPKTREHYRTTWRTHINSYLGHLRMRDITADIIQQLIYDATNRAHSGKKSGDTVTGYSPQSLRHIKNMLSLMFKKAKRLQWYSGDLPTVGVELPPLKRIKERHALTPDQAQQLVVALTGHPKPVRELVCFLLLSGVRIGEAAGLVWRNVNLTDEHQLVDGLAIPPRTAAIRLNFVLGAYQSVKSAAGVRMLPLRGHLFELLAKWRSETPFPDPNDPVFPNKNGKPIDYHNIAARVLRPTAKQLGMPWLSWHVFRHTSHTAAGMLGASVSMRKLLYGWTEDRMALLYDHVSVDGMGDMIQKVGAYLLGNCPATANHQAESSAIDSQQPSGPLQQPAALIDPESSYWSLPFDDDSDGRIAD